MSEIKLGSFVRTVGEILPYSFADKETGEEIGGVNLMTPGETVSVSVDPKIAERMKPGEIWAVEGQVRASMKNGGARLRIPRPTKLERLRAAETAEGPVIDWNEKATAKA